MSRYGPFLPKKLALVGQSDVCLTDDQEVTSSSLPGPATFFHGDLILKYFLL